MTLVETMPGFPMKGRQIAYVEAQIANRPSNCEGSKA
jgi:hypothetical protein